VEKGSDSQEEKSLRSKAERAAVIERQNSVRFVHRVIYICGYPGSPGPV
jgi:hypothetical protein